MVQPVCPGARAAIGQARCPVPGSSPWRAALSSLTRFRGAATQPSAERPDQPLHRTVSPAVAALCALAASSAAVAQEPYSPLVPRGTLRLDARGLYVSYADERLTSALSGPAGAGGFPFLARTESAVASMIGEPWNLTLGSMQTVAERSSARVPIALDVGVFDWLTVGAVVPLAGSDAEFSLHFSADSVAANAGFNPVLDGEVPVTIFMNGLQSAIADYGAYRDATCEMDPSSPECAGATRVLQEASDFEGSASLLYGEMFAPLASSAAGEALQARLAVLSEAFAAAGVTSPGTIPLSTTPVTFEDLQSFVTDPRYGIASSQGLAKWRSVWQLGDVELHADARLAEAGGTESSYRVVAGAGATVRLPTGSQADPANFLATGSGDAQWDVELRGWMNGRWPRGFGMWADLRYGVQVGGGSERRVFDPAAPFAPLSTQAQLDWDPGDYQIVELSPWFRISEGLSALAGYRLFRKGEDSFALRPQVDPDPAAAPPAPPPDPSVLVPGTGYSASHLLLGMVYNRAAADQGGISGAPLEIRVVYRQVVGGSDSDIPREASLEVGFRLFRRIWGG